MQVLTASQMRTCDERTVSQFGISFQTLMENAGSATAAFVLQQFPAAQRITILVGKGNNGGDGLVAARHLAAAGKQVRCILLAEPKSFPETLRAVYESLPPALQQSCILAEPTLSPEVEACLTPTDLILDAIFGTGFRPPLTGAAAALQQRTATHSAPVVSVDLPSGWDADSTATANPDAFRSNAVVTFTAPKLAHVFGAITRGPIAVAPIGSPDQAIPTDGNITWTGTAKQNIEAPRNPNSNKGRFGHVLVIGGSPGKSGAPSMSSLAAMRSGAGLVTAAIPRSIANIVAGFAPEMMTLLLEEESSGSIASKNLDQLEKILKGISVLAIGPGIGRDPRTAEFVRQLVQQTKLSTVLDADGLNAFEGQADLLDGRDRTLVLTPHPGEMARLLGCTIPEVERDRIATARNFATKHHVTLVLKGWRTLVAHPDGSIAVNTSGNPAMAKGGTGDVLTGIVAALIAQFPKQIREAVECAVWLHGAAADIYVRTHDEHTMLATDLLQHISEAIQQPLKRDGLTWLQEGSRR